MRLSHKEIIEICNELDNFRTDKVKSDEFCLNQHKQVLALQLLYKEFPEDIEIDDIKNVIFDRFCNALIIPGKSYGHLAASSNSEPATQKVLKSSHSAGTEGKKCNETWELISCAKDPKANWMSIRLSSYEYEKYNCENFINQLIKFNYKYVVKPNIDGKTFSVQKFGDNELYIIINISIENMLKSRHTIFDCVQFLKENKIDVYCLREVIDDDGEPIFKIYIDASTEENQTIYTTLLTFNLNNIMGITNPQTTKKDIIKDCVISIVNMKNIDESDITDIPFLNRNNTFNKELDKQFDDYIRGNTTLFIDDSQIDYRGFLNNINLDEYFIYIQYVYDMYKSNYQNQYVYYEFENKQYIKYKLDLYPLCVSPKRIKYMLYRLFILNENVLKVYLDYDIGDNLCGFRLVTTNNFNIDFNDFTDNSKFLYNIYFDISDNADANNVLTIIYDNKDKISINELTTANLNTMYKLYGITAAKHFAYRRWVDLVSPKGEVPQMFIEILLTYSYEQFAKPFGIARAADATRNPLTLGAEGGIMQRLVVGSLAAKKFPIQDNITQNLTGSQCTVFGLNFVKTECNTDIGREILKEHNMSIVNTLTEKSPIFKHMIMKKSKYTEPIPY